MRRLDPAALHVTLVFLGSHPAAALPEVKAALPRIDARCRLEVEELRRLRGLVALSLRDRDGRAEEIRGQVAAGLAPFHPGEPRPWWPHVTLARGPAPTRVAGRNLPVTIEIASLTLYRSHPGSRYEAL